MEYDTDDFCLEAGAFPKMGPARPGDYRGRGSEGGRVVDRLFIQVNLRRTVHPIGVLEIHSQFDDEAFEMNAVLYFEPTEEKRPSVFVERQDPGHLKRELTAAMDRPLLRSLVGRGVDSVVYFVGGAG